MHNCHITSSCHISVCVHAQTSFLMCCFAPPPDKYDHAPPAQGSLQDAAQASGAEEAQDEEAGPGPGTQRAARSRSGRGTWEIHLRAGANSTRTIKFEASQAT